MSNKLEIKAELLRHLSTAKEMEQDSKASSMFKVIVLEVEIDLVDRNLSKPNLEFWRQWLEE